MSQRRSLDSGTPTAQASTGPNTSRPERPHLREVLSHFSPVDIPDGEQRRVVPTATGAFVRGLKHPNRKLAQDEVLKLVADYLGSASLKQLARQFGMHEQRVKAHLQRNDVELRRWTALTLHCRLRKRSNCTPPERPSRTSVNYMAVVGTLCAGH